MALVVEPNYSLHGTVVTQENGMCKLAFSIYIVEKDAYGKHMPEEEFTPGFAEGFLSWCMTHSDAIYELVLLRLADKGKESEQ